MKENRQEYGKCNVRQSYLMRRARRAGAIASAVDDFYFRSYLPLLESRNTEA